MLHKGLSTLSTERTQIQIISVSIVCTALSQTTLKWQEELTRGCLSRTGKTMIERLSETLEIRSGNSATRCRSGPVGGARVVFTGNSATRATRDLWEASALCSRETVPPVAARDLWEAPALCSRETVPPVPLGIGGRRPRCVHGKQCHPCRSGPVGGVPPCERKSHNKND